MQCVVTPSSNSCLFLFLLPYGAVVPAFLEAEHGDEEVFGLSTNTTRYYICLEAAYCMTEPINVHSLKVSGFENISAAGMQHIGQCLTKLRVFGKQCSKTNTNRSLHVQCRYLMYLGALLGLQWQPFWHRQLMHLGMCSG